MLSHKYSKLSQIEEQNQIKKSKSHANSSLLQHSNIADKDSERKDVDKQK
jgi:hypothetical protein